MIQNYTGHPFLDVGLATLTAFARKRHPRELTSDDLEEAADYMARNYVVNPLKSFLSVAFTSNAWFIQPAYDPDKAGLTPEKSAERRQERQLWAERHLYQWRNQPIDYVTGERDVFTGLPAAAEPLSKRLRPGRGARAQIPLVLGDEYINFLAYGDPGLPISGLSVLALYMMPLGCAKVGGRLLAVHSDDPDLLLHFARSFLEANRRNVQAAQTAGEKKLPETSSRRVRTLLIEYLLNAEKMRRKSEQEESPVTITAYHFTNSGQGVDLDIYPLPLEVASFVASAQSVRYRDAWQALVSRAWQITKAKRGSQEAPPPTYNRLYEDLFNLPETSAFFIRTYFLRRPNRLRPWKKGEDPTVDYDSGQEAHLISWPLTELFLRKVMLMDPIRIQHIRELGDDLANYIVDQNDRRFFFNFYTARSYGQMRAELIKASQAEVKRGRPPLITLDRFLAVFEQVEGLPYEDWRLGRDLVLIRMFEQLHQRGWLQQHVDELIQNGTDETE